MNFFIEYVFCAVGIYCCFLTWGILQEKISSTFYESASSSEKFTDFAFLNLCQSICAFLVALIYWVCSVQPKVKFNYSFTSKMFLVSLSSTLASPFGYESLKHVDYPTMLLAKSCKLIPVILASIALHNRRFSRNQYYAVALVTVGVALFSSSSKKESSSSFYGLFLLFCNLCFDGITNSTQDAIFVIHKISSVQMMLFLNFISSILSIIYLMFSSSIVPALVFIHEHPSLIPDILFFSLCGALGQVFIFRTLSKLGSLSLVSITVTRKMMSIMLSVILYNHQITPKQWFAIILVFVGIILEVSSKK